MNKIPRLNRNYFWIDFCFQLFLLSISSITMGNQKLIIFSKKPKPKQSRINNKTQPGDKVGRKKKKNSGWAIQVYSVYHHSLYLSVHPPIHPSSVYCLYMQGVILGTVHRVEIPHALMPHCPELQSQLQIYPGYMIYKAHNLCSLMLLISVTDFQIPSSYGC